MSTEPGSENGSAVLDWLTALGFVLAFAVLFAQLPLQGALAGNSDTWLVGIALPNALGAQILEAFGGATAGTSLFPAENALAYGETTVGTALVFFAFRALGCGDVVAHFLQLVTLFSWNALGVYALSREFVQTRAAAIFAGIAFGTCNAVLAQIDSIQGVFWGIAALSLAAWCRFLRTLRSRDALLAAGLAGLQVYFGAYVFAFLSLAIAVLTLTRLRTLVRVESWSALALAALIAMPFFGYYASNSQSFVAPWEGVSLSEMHSLEPVDLLRPLPGNLIYSAPDWTPLDRPLGLDTALVAEGVRPLDLDPADRESFFGSDPQPELVRHYVATRRSAHTGLVLIALAAIAIFTFSRGSIAWLGVLLAGLCVASGPYIRLDDALHRMPLAPLYEADLATVLRVPARAITLAVLALCVLAAIGLDRLLALPSLAGRRTLIAATALGLVLVENIPVPLPAFSATHVEPPAEYARALSELERGVVLELPSRIGAYIADDSEDLYGWNRESLYMNWQTRHRFDIVNGVNGYFPAMRIEVQKIIDRLPDASAFQELRELGVDYIALHRELFLPGDGDLGPLIEGLALNPALERVFDGESTALFRWRPLPAPPVSVSAPPVPGRTEQLDPPEHE